MSIWNRIGLVFKSNVNAAISKAEDPEKVLNQLLVDMREQFIKAKKQVAIAIADEKRLYAKANKSKSSSQEWEKKAMLALSKGNEELAREALQRKSTEDELATGFQKQWVAQKTATEKLRGQLHQLQRKIDEAKRKKDLLIARQKRAEAQKSIQQTMGGLNDNSAFDAFDRMTEKVEQNEAEADAAEDLGDELSGKDLEDQFAALEHEGSTNDALAALKAKMGMTAEISEPARLSLDDSFPVPEMNVDADEKLKI